MCATTEKPLRQDLNLFFPLLQANHISKHAISEKIFRGVLEAVKGGDLAVLLSTLEKAVLDLQSDEAKLLEEGPEANSQFLFLTLIKVACGEDRLIAHLQTCITLINSHPPELFNLAFVVTVLRQNGVSV